MIRRFGEFELDEAARSLTLRGRAIDLQPKVFDLLAYLVANAGRVVPKDELMDALWPKLTVTEASLQRAVSLARRALREGGLEDALKSFVRHGYRLAIDHPPLQEVLPQLTSGMAEVSQQARRLASERDWQGACTAFAAADDALLSAADLDLWAFCKECLGRPSEALPMLAIALDRHLATENPKAAGRSAANLGKIHLERGEAAIARGWLLRAAALIGDADASDARSYLLWMQARYAAFEGQAEEAQRLSLEARTVARQAGSLSLEALALAYLGFFNLSLGRAREGLEQQDHAAAMALSSQVDPLTGSLIYCNILWSCRSYADWARANQWVAGFETWTQANFAQVTSTCKLHRAEVEGVNGSLSQALAGVEAALKMLPTAEPWTLGDAHRVRGDILAAMGDVEAARLDYARAYEAGWDAEPGNAVLLFEAGDVTGALAALDRVMAGVGWFSLQRQGWLLAHKARICAVAGEHALARQCLQTLQANFDRWPSPAVRALVAEASAYLSADVSVEQPSSIQHLSLARQLWTSIGAEHQAARVRLLLGERLMDQGDFAGAQVEFDCALLGADKVGAKGLSEQARRCSGLLAERRPNPAGRAAAELA